ncbi:hypothetical protein ACWC4E_31275 [Streptomyces sp. NPDC001273]
MIELLPAPVPVSHLHASLEKAFADGFGTGVESFANLRQWHALLVEADGRIDLLVSELAPTSLDVLSLEDAADGLSADTEATAQFVDGGSGLVCGDEVLGLLTFDLFGSTRGDGSLALDTRLGGVWQLAQQCFQGDYLGFYVRVGLATAYP